MNVLHGRYSIFLVSLPVSHFKNVTRFIFTPPFPVISCILQHFGKLNGHFYNIQKKDSFSCLLVVAIIVLGSFRFLCFKNSPDVLFVTNRVSVMDRSFVGAAAGVIGVYFVAGEMRTIATTLGLAAGAVWEWWRRRRGSGNGEKEAVSWSVRAYSFQSELSFSDAKRMLGVGALGESEAGGPWEWYERDSAWYDELLSCSGRTGVRMNLYRFEDEWVLELKAVGADADRGGAEAFAKETLMPALGARDVKKTGPVN